MPQEMVDKQGSVASEQTLAPVIHVAPSPHVSDGALTTRRMMGDVLIGLAPLMVVAIVVFRVYALKQVAICVVGCVGAEALFSLMRGRCPCVVADLSGVVTGVILALSLPWSAPWYVALIGAGVAIGIGKVVFGGLGQNLFNPAMVGRAFVMLCFSKALGAGKYVAGAGTAVAQAVTRATPMTAMKEGEPAGLLDLFVGNTNGSLGEVSALACIVGGLYLCLRRTASWEIPVGTILVVAVVAIAMDLAGSGTSFTAGHHLLGGALLFGAFFIATDPVTSPLTPKGKWIFGAGLGALVMLIRCLSNYPEGVMFAVLLMNAAVPLINRWTVPTPVGGPTGDKT